MSFIVDEHISDNAVTNPQNAFTGRYF